MCDNDQQQIINSAQLINNPNTPDETSSSKSADYQSKFTNIPIQIQLLKQIHYDLFTNSTMNKEYNSVNPILQQV